MGVKDRTFSPTQISKLGGEMRNIKLLFFLLLLPVFSLASQITYIPALSPSEPVTYEPPVIYEPPITYAPPTATVPPITPAPSTTSALPTTTVPPTATVYSAVKDGNFALTDPDPDEWDNLLRQAVKDENFELVRLLIEKGADVDSSSDEWFNPLRQAVRDGNFELVRLLIEKGAKVDLGPDQFGPIHEAAMHHDHDVGIQMTKLLMEHGADIHALTFWDHSPLYLAVRYSRNVRLAEFLIKHGADMNTTIGVSNEYPEHPGFSPLHWAVKWADVPMVAMLLENGADVNVTDAKGRTPLYYAETPRCCTGVNGPERLVEIAKLLRSAGADSDSPTPPIVVASLTTQGDLVPRGNYAPFSLNRIHFGEEVFAHDNQHIRRWVTHFSTGSGREIMSAILERSNRYIDLMKDIFQEQGLPTDLVYMSMVESGFSTHARSRANAVGYWQFLQSTGHHYGLRIDSEVDDRLDFALSTQAAGRYMQNMYSVFEDWLLSMAAYNCGQNCVLRAIRKHNSKDFWHLVENKALPQETRNYVPKIIAMKIIASDPSSYGFANLDYQTPLEYSFISVDQTAFLSDIAEDINVPYRILKRLNSRFVSGVVSVEGEAVHIRVPANTEKL